MKSVLKRFGNYYIQKICEREYQTQKSTTINERPIEFGFVFQQLTKYWPTTVLDVGTGLTALPHLMRNCGFVVTAIDNIKDYWTQGMVNRHYYVINDDIKNTQLKEKFDFISCVSVLEHIQENDKAVGSMLSLLNGGGHLVLTFPYNEKSYIENVYDLPGSIGRNKYPFMTQAYSRRELDRWLANFGGKIKEQQYWQLFTGDYWTLGARVCPPLSVGKDDKHQLCCICIEKT